MELTLDYNIELYPLKNDQSFSLALASSLVHTGEGIANGDAEEDKDTHIWRPDGKGRRGLEEEYDYVMYGRVCRQKLRLLSDNTNKSNIRCTNLMAGQPKLCTSCHMLVRVVY